MYFSAQMKKPIWKSGNPAAKETSMKVKWISWQNAVICICQSYAYTCTYVSYNIFPYRLPIQAEMTNSIIMKNF